MCVCVCVCVCVRVCVCVCVCGIKRLRHIAFSALSVKFCPFSLNNTLCVYTPAPVLDIRTVACTQKL